MRTKNRPLSLVFTAATFIGLWVVGWLFLLAGFAKASHLQEFAERINDAQVVSERVSLWGVIFLCALEIYLGTAVLYFPSSSLRIYLIAIVALTGVYTGWLLYQGPGYSCPCFGIGKVSNIASFLNGIPLRRNCFILTVCCLSLLFERRRQSSAMEG